MQRLCTMLSAVKKSELYPFLLTKKNIDSIFTFFKHLQTKKDLNSSIWEGEASL